MIYLDYNATTPLRSSIIPQMIDVMKYAGNPSSVHQMGRKNRKIIDEARKSIAKNINCLPTEVYFTSSGTEANNLVLAGLFEKNRIYVSSVEHDSLLQDFPPSQQIPVDSHGLIDLKKLEEILNSSKEPLLISIMYANNETGVIQPLYEICKLVHSYGHLIHTDAVQALGRIPLSFQESNVDFMTLSSHKIGGPMGVGALIVKSNIHLKALIKGGGQERGFRSGTENTPGIFGFALALNESTLENWDLVKNLRDQLEKELLQISPTSHVFGSKAQRLPNTLCISMPGVESETQVISFDLQGIAVSAGSACSSGKVKKSHVLKAMGFNEIDASYALRISLGQENTNEEIHKFIYIWKELYNRLGCQNHAIHSIAS